jgi:hypothetical protein
MATPRTYTHLREFYPYYLSEHRDVTCRMLHFVGTALVVLSLLAGIVSLHWAFFAAIPVLGYGFAWVGHAFFERNKPATFTYPAMSLASDFILFWDTLNGTLPRKLEAAKREYPASKS